MSEPTIKDLHPTIQEFHELVYHFREGTPGGVLFAYSVVSSFLSYAIQDHPERDELVAGLEWQLYDYLGMNKMTH
jgi:hypothetical protein